MPVLYEKVIKVFIEQAGSSNVVDIVTEGVSGLKICQEVSVWKISLPDSRKILPARYAMF